MTQRQVPFLNLAALHGPNGVEYLAEIGRLIQESRFVGGEELDAFEREFASWLGPGLFATGCGNGTDALMLAAKALELPEGSEAVIPAMTFVATAEGLLHAGVKVRLADISEGTWLVDPAEMEKAMNARTKLLVPVHFYGQMCPMDSIRKLADRTGCRILEDSAQAHGAQWKGEGPGQWGDVAAFSFFPSKNLGGFGDGGAVVSRSQALIQKSWCLGKHGGPKKYEHLWLGHNSRLDNVQAAILRFKLRFIDGWNDRRRQAASWYREALHDVADIRLPVEAPEAKHVYHLFVITTESRDRLAAALKHQGIETGIHYPLPLHQLPAFRDTELANGKFPNAERLSKQGLSLPMGPTLERSEVEYVAGAIRRFFNGRS